MMRSSSLPLPRKRMKVSVIGEVVTPQVLLTARNSMSCAAARAQGDGVLHAGRLSVGRLSVTSRCNWSWCELTMYLVQ